MITQKQCQICKTTELEAAWRCTSCGEPICSNCMEELTSVGKRIECFNVLCRRNVQSESVPEKTVSDLKFERVKRIVTALHDKKQSIIGDDWAKAAKNMSKKYEEGVKAALGKKKS